MIYISIFEKINKVTLLWHTCGVIEVSRGVNEATVANLQTMSSGLDAIYLQPPGFQLMVKDN